MSVQQKYGGRLIIEADFASGDKFDIIAAITENGHCPFWDEFFESLRERYNESLRKSISLGKKDQKNFKTLQHYFDKFCKRGPWSNKQQLRPIENGFYEFKCITTGLRVIFYYDDKNRNVIILTHYFDKGGHDKTPRKEKKRMYEIKKSFDKKRERGGC